MTSAWPPHTNPDRSALDEIAGVVEASDDILSPRFGPWSRSRRPPTASWRSLETPGGLVRALLVTRYTSLAAWERSRPYAPEAVPGAERAKFLRRAELSQRTIVRLVGA